MKYIKLLLGLLTVISLLTSCSKSTKTENQNMADSTQKNEYQLPNKSAFQQTIDGKKTDLYILKIVMICKPPSLITVEEW